MPVDCLGLQVVFNGVYPIFDPAGTFSASMTRTCSGAPLDAVSYAVWYSATDIYGVQTPLVIDPVTIRP